MHRQKILVCARLGSSAIIIDAVMSRITIRHRASDSKARLFNFSFATNEAYGTPVPDGHMNDATIGEAKQFPRIQSCLTSSKHVRARGTQNTAAQRNA